VRLRLKHSATPIRASDSHTAILFFSHRPEREWSNKRLVRRDRAKSQQVAGALYAHTLHAARSSGLPVLEVTDAQQRGGSFGTRFANAFADAFAQGYDRVIAVGSDCPRLHEVDWRAAVERLERGAPVLGPTTDRGGAYLIGLRREQFDQAAFAALPWQTPALFTALAQHLSTHTEIAPSLLAARGDVNGHRDLVALLYAPASLPVALIARLRTVLGPIEHTVPVARLISSGPVSNHPSRAPPWSDRLRARA
jgi:glycosyltransferase A (GT-A) superfamily protein (DUF2064 family)